MRLSGLPSLFRRSHARTLSTLRANDRLNAATTTRRLGDYAAALSALRAAAFALIVRPALVPLSCARHPWLDRGEDTHLRWASEAALANAPHSPSIRSIVGESLDSDAAYAPVASPYTPTPSLGRWCRARQTFRRCPAHRSPHRACHRRCLRPRLRRYRENPLPRAHRKPLRWEIRSPKHAKAGAGIGNADHAAAGSITEDSVTGAGAGDADNPAFAAYASAVAATLAVHPTAAGACTSNTDPIGAGS